MKKHIIYGPVKKWTHVAFWIASIGLMLFFLFLNEEQVHIDPEIITKALITNLGFAFAVYINLYVLIPRFLKKKNYIFYVFWLVITLTGSSLFIQYLFLFPLNRVLDLGPQFQSYDPNLHSSYFFASLLYVAFTSFLKFIRDWLELQDLNLKLARIEQQKLEAELKALKGQLNPHFLFNSLNNIYSLSLVGSEKVPEYILRLSDLMRHIIYDSRDKYIPLEKEIHFVQNFIELQKIRTTEKVRIDYTVKGEISPAKIAPMLFEPFIDNAFKHGLPGLGKSDFINISFDFTNPRHLIFRVTNNFCEQEAEENKSGGIGIENVKQRLKHLYSPKDYNLEISTKATTYSISLKLKLKDHDNKSLNHR